jgi:hypothetical protein
MKVFTNTECEGYYPVGFAAVVVAKDAEEAAVILNETLKKMGLEPQAKADGMKWIRSCRKKVHILVDGEY